MGNRYIGVLLSVLAMTTMVAAIASGQTVPGVVVESAAETSAAETNTAETNVAKGQTPDDFQVVKTQSLFDGQSLDPWEITSFGGEGDVSVEDGCIEMAAGDPFTAVNLREDFELPTVDYEIAYEAMKVEGTDFFGTLTFPVKDNFCSMVVGGWAGTVVGLSSIDGQDASENETRLVRKFEKNQWYKIRVRVTDGAIEAWIDDRRVINQLIQGKKVSLRSEMIPCQPLGIANFYTVAKIKNVELRWLERAKK